MRYCKLKTTERRCLPLSPPWCTLMGKSSQSIMYFSINRCKESIIQVVYDIILWVFLFVVVILNFFSQFILSPPLHRLMYVVSCDAFTYLWFHNVTKLRFVSMSIVIQPLQLMDIAPLQSLLTVPFIYTAIWEAVLIVLTCSHFQILTVFSVSSPMLLK